MISITWEEVVLILGLVALVAAFAAYWLHLREVDRARMYDRWREENRYQESRARLDIEAHSGINPGD